MKNDMISNDLPLYLFHQGTNFRSHDFFGCHFIAEKVGSVVFRVWAPRAASVSVVGDFNDWQVGLHPMQRLSDTGVWEAIVDGIIPEQRYKYALKLADGRCLLKSDPFAFYAETDEQTASIIYDIEGYAWQDAKWMSARANISPYDTPMNIYEVHLGSWRHDDTGKPLSYLELANQLIPYLLEMGYTHLELMPVMEHPFGRSWGYQICGYYAATSRYGTPHDLMALIDRCHQAGIGVILDWVPAHFPKDAHGLYEFDGAPLYEAQGPDRMEQREWGTRHFDFGRTEVQSFLISNAVFWLEYFHADALRVDAVSSMLYLDYGKKRGEWVPNTLGTNVNLDAVAFIRKLNKAISDLAGGAMVFAEEATTWQGLTKPVHEGGLGFTFKWNMGWMNDMLDYIKVDPVYRKAVHEKITFSFYYAFSERFVLPISHDEVVYGKRSLLDKNPGDYAAKFAGARAFLGYMMTHPGKKLHFMGSEIGQFKEWDYADQVEWFLLEYEAHRQYQSYVKALNAFYLNTPALWQADDSWDGFRWISPDDRAQNIVVFMRLDKAENAVIVVQNFAPVKRENYAFGVPDRGVYREVFSSDRCEFGGSGIKNGELRAEETALHGYPYMLNITVPPLSTVIFMCKEV